MLEGETGGSSHLAPDDERRDLEDLPVSAVGWSPRLRELVAGRVEIAGPGGGHGEQHSLADLGGVVGGGAGGHEVHRARRG